MISPHFRYAHDFNSRRVAAPVACGLQRYEMQTLPKLFFPFKSSAFSFNRRVFVNIYTKSDAFKLPSLEKEGWPSGRGG
jgi:hypothetical protein